MSGRMDTGMYEWMGQQFNPAAPHEIKKYIEGRYTSRKPTSIIRAELVKLTPGNGMKVGPFNDVDEKWKIKAEKTLRNVASNLEWPEGASVGPYTSEDGQEWIMVVRGKEPKEHKTSYNIVI